MNLTRLQERRLQQVKDEIAFLEKETQKKDGWYALRFSLGLIIVMVCAEYLFDLLSEGKSLPVFLDEYRWVSLATNWMFCFLFFYVFMVKGNQKQLKIKKNELLRLYHQYGVHEESIS